MVLSALKVEYFEYNQLKIHNVRMLLASHPSNLSIHLKILTPKQMLQRLPMALAKQVIQLKIYYMKCITSNILCITQKK